MTKDLDAVIASTQKLISSTEIEVEQRSADRSIIAKWIVKTFLWLLGITVVFVIIATIVSFFRSGVAWDTNVKEPAEFLMSILSSVLLPVVTLVIGYYFGSRVRPKS